MTAEFAAALPAALVCLAVAIGAVQAGGQQLRLIDAAAVDARLLGRGDAPRGVEQRSVPDATPTVERERGMVCVTLTATSTVVGLGALGLRVSGQACALDESALVASVVDASAVVASAVDAGAVVESAVMDGRWDSRVG